MAKRGPKTKHPAERASEQITAYVSPQTLRRVDRARGPVPIARWLRELIERSLGQ